MVQNGQSVTKTRVKSANVFGYSEESLHNKKTLLLRPFEASYDKLQVLVPSYKYPVQRTIPAAPYNGLMEIVA